MRPKLSRRIASAALACVTVLAVSACANPPGTDGEIANEWPVMSAPTGWEPKVGTCHKSFVAAASRNAYSPTDCTKNHFYETVHLGTFTGDAAKAPAPPASGTVEYSAAYAECDAKTTEFLGGDWHGGRIWIGLSIPSRGGWEGGARWFRCEVAALEGRFGGSQLSWSKSLKGVLSGESELKFGCYQIPKEDDKDWTAVPCTTAHNGEFVGAYPTTYEWDKLGDDRTAIHRKCLTIIAAFAGVPDDGNLKYRTGSYYSYGSSKDWAAGDHSIRCHLWLDSKNMTRSMKGAGTKGLPINYS